MLAETVNTDCPLALANFYLDPSHVRPVPAELLRFILEQAALKVDHLTYSSPAPGNDVSEVLKLTWGASCVYQDYAILARKGEGH